jgi:hypothetical protein
MHKELLSKRHARDRDWSRFPCAYLGDLKRMLQVFQKAPKYCLKEIRYSREGGAGQEYGP